ncbi:MAG: hypothetical protein ABI743_02240 [bacterium]
MRRIAILALGGLSLVLSGCPVGASRATPAPPVADAPALPDVASVIIVNSLGESLSRYDPTQSPPALANDLVLTGQSPNDVVLAGDRILVVNSLSNSVGLYDLATLTLQHEWSTGPRTNPWNGLVLGDTAWVSCWASQELVGLDLTDGAIVARLAAPSTELPHDDGLTTRAYPQGVAATLNGATLLVTCANLGDSFSAAGAGVVWMIDVASAPPITRGLIALSSGRNAADIIRTTVAGREAFVVVCAGDFDAASGYVGNGSFHLIDGPTLSELAAIPVASAPVRVTAYGSQAFGAGAQEGDVSHVDLADRSARPIIVLPDSGTGLNYCSALAVTDPDHLLALDFNGDRLYAIEVSTGTVSGGLTVGDGPVALVVVPK